MPAISLVVCIFQERELLERLLRHTDGCYDELIVVHDGREKIDDSLTHRAPDHRVPMAVDFSAMSSRELLPHDYGESLDQSGPVGSIQELVQRYQGKFYEHPRIGSLEGQSPFAWSRTHSNWILRLDADEVPSTGLKDWLQAFRNGPEPDVSVAGYTCIWPLWNGRRAVTKCWPSGRQFIFHKDRVRYFGLVEQVPLASEGSHFEKVPVVLEHRPPRKSHGLRNVLFRRQAYDWRTAIARGLLGKPTDLPRWRWNSTVWPDRWEEVRQNPVRIGLSRLFMDTLRTLRDQWKNERRILVGAAINGPIHHALFCFQFWRLRRRQGAKKSA